MSGLRSRALAARRDQLGAEERRRANEQAVSDARQLREMVDAWLQLGVTTCQHEITRRDNLGWTFERDGYLLGYCSDIDGEGGGLTMVYNDVHLAWVWTYNSLEQVGEAMVRIDAAREEHYANQDRYARPGRRLDAEELEAHVAGCHACQVRDRGAAELLAAAIVPTS